ncbi:hypothetical protein ACEQ8H_008980 [Pleosporales sp. CAS-2024a]
MSAPFVRPYDPCRDFDAGLDVFYSTIDPTLDSEPSRTIGSHLWYKVYTDLSPSTCFVLDNGTGRAVGYCIGAANTTAFAQQWRTVFMPAIDPALIPPPDVQTLDPRMETDAVRGLRKAAYFAECSSLQSFPATVDKFPAHLHVNILPEWQGKGWGRVLIERLFEELKGMGAQGVHLGMVRWNTGARRFYEKIGFGACEEVLDGGKSGEAGVSGGTVTLVKRL